jgi:hypothetical protein
MMTEEERARKHDIVFVKTIPWAIAWYDVFVKTIPWAIACGLSACLAFFLFSGSITSTLFAVITLLFWSGYSLYRLVNEQMKHSDLWVKPKTQAGVEKKEE